MLKTFLVCVSLVGMVSCQPSAGGGKLTEKEFNFANPSGVFGFVPNLNKLEYSELVNHYKEGCVECLGRKDRSYTVKKACNLYVTCVDFGNVVYMYGRSCGKKTMFNEINENCIDYPATETPFCENPCLYGMKFPVDDRECGKYHTCSIVDGKAVISETPCDGNYGFNAFTGICDWPCPGGSYTEKIVNETCSEDSDGDYYQVKPLIEKTAKDGSKTYRVGEATRRRCAASLKHIRKDSCLCDRVDPPACQQVTSVRLSSVDNSWSLARNNNPIANTSAIEGNATITDITDAFPKSAFFTHKSIFMAPKLTQNDLGLRFSFNFDFLARTLASNYSESGVSIPNDNKNLNDVALADNSNCGYKPTYGCMLRVTRPNRGKIVCYVKPRNVGPENHREVESTEVDLTRRIMVYFAKDDTLGELRVTEGQGEPRISTVTFPAGVRAEGNRCPLTLGGGTEKRYFTGYMDNMLLVRYCESFLQ